MVILNNYYNNNMEIKLSEVLNKYETYGMFMRQIMII